MFGVPGEGRGLHPAGGLVQPPPAPGQGEAARLHGRRQVHARRDAQVRPVQQLLPPLTSLKLRQQPQSRRQP